MLREMNLFTIITVQVCKENGGPPYFLTEHVSPSGNTVSEKWFDSSYSTKQIIQQFAVLWDKNKNVTLRYMYMTGTIICFKRFARQKRKRYYQVTGFQFSSNLGYTHM